MKRTAFLINTARGPIINEAELVQALREGIIAGAGVSVSTYLATHSPTLIVSRARDGTPQAPCPPFPDPLS